MFKSKCVTCGKRKKYGMDIFFYRKALFRSVKKFFICYACYMEA